MKKANIFVGNEGYKLGDFGISKVQFVSKTASKEAGTYDYMAPEIRMHQKFGFNSDIYSLGMVMYRLLNNDKFPFVPTDGTDTIDVHMEAQEKRESGIPFPPPLNSKKADNNGKLTEIVLKACEFDRNNRYQSASEMKRDLISLNKIAENKDIQILKPKETIESSYTSTMSEKPSIGTISERPDAIKSNPSNKGGNKSKGIIAVTAAVIIAAIVIGWNIFSPVPIEDITGVPTNNDNSSLVVGETLDLNPELVPEKAEGKIEYISSDKSVASINEEGIIKALSEGDTLITVICEDVEKSFKLSVSPAVIKVENIEGVMESKELEVEKSFNIGCKVIPEDATDKTITYSSSDESIATVDKNGNIKALKAGATTITVKAGDVVKIMKLTVKANAVASVKKNDMTDNNDQKTETIVKKPFVNNKKTTGGGSNGGSSKSGTSGGSSSSVGSAGGSSGGGASSGGSAGSSSGGGSQSSTFQEGDLTGSPDYD